MNRPIRIVLFWMRNLYNSMSRRVLNLPFVLFLILVPWTALAFGPMREGKGGSEDVEDEIRARRFIAVDETGRETAEFGVLKNGSPGIVVWNRAKTGYASIRFHDNGMPRLSFENATGDAIIDLGLQDSGFPAFIMATPDSTRRLAMIVTPTGEGSIILSDSAKRGRCAISVDANGNPEVRMRNSAGTVRARLMVHKEGGAALDLFDNEGRTRAVIQVNDKGDPDVALLGPEGEALWSARGQLVGAMKVENPGKEAKPK